MQAKRTGGMELQERVSYVSATQDKPAGEDYDDGKTPVDLEDGALRAGGAPDYLSREVLGLLAQYVCVGLVYGCLPNILYPVFTGYYHMTGAQYNSAKTLVNIGWSLKAFIGMISDCVPIKGYRRKSWMMIGWTCCLCFLLVLSCMDLGEPYYPVDAVGLKDPIDRTAADNATINYNAKDKGGVVAILFGLATISYLFADVPADALLAGIGNEGIVYGLLTTVSNLPSAVGPVLSNRIYSNFDVNEDAIISDTKHVRNQVAYTYLIYYAGFLIACCTSFFLPKQKLQLHELQRTGGQFPLIGGFVLVFCFCMLVYSITCSILSMFESTSCLLIAGGSGC
ncbi:hypothetical protein SDRG_06797 [Saprolegnia diclina VS20]|uniref:Uncharacterized protein n=1 Tax=Saprolegnia diclina (strain VS20) TaxID=1156394 RepID=T0S0C7_SAPDV|nr:hypothetical protein SDRG_06797 [Saprolegnia diclina VS20]EQC36062.1 hypothetical protein SDRG_06797 [Saprolegnia diclina VS20]|eukprot:XP_008610824.1 hypothetical protein SDRG_06797 [Saprolegnia diclina VS20]